MSTADQPTETVNSVRKRMKFREVVDVSLAHQFQTGSGERHDRRTADVWGTEEDEQTDNHNQHTDLVVQAKSGTGKTLVFAILALEQIVPQNYSPQVVIVAPTREIAHQISECIKTIGSPLKKAGLQVGLFIGGTSLSDNHMSLNGICQIVVGSPGRLCQLVKQGALNLQSVRLFVLDEADKLMDQSFIQTINYLFSSMPESKQVAVFSATYPDELDQLLTHYMRTPTMIRLNPDDVQLLGIKQYMLLTTLPAAKKSETNSGDDEKTFSARVFQTKMAMLTKLLSHVQYSQCLIFCNYLDRCEEVCSALRDGGFEATFISGNLQQDQRQKVMRQLKLFKTRLLVTTDLTARGVDAQNVNMVVNFEVPTEPETYFHRIGRAGRFGGYGAAVTIVVKEADGRRFALMGSFNNFTVKILSSTLDSVPTDLCVNADYWQQGNSINFKTLIARMRKSPSPTSRYQDCIVFYGKSDTIQQTEQNGHIDTSQRKSGRLEPDEYIALYGSPNSGELSPVYQNGAECHCYSRDQLLALQEQTGENERAVQSHHKASPLSYNRRELLSIRNALPADFLAYHSFAALPEILSTRALDYQNELEQFKVVLKGSNDGGSIRRPVSPIMSPNPSSTTTTASCSTTTTVSSSHSGWVPSRLKNKRKFYMRGELLTIRDNLDTAFQRQFVEFWKLSESPVSKNSVQAGEMSSGVISGETLKMQSAVDLVEGEKLSPVPDSHHTDITLFNKAEMESIREKLGDLALRELANSRYDLTADPFVLDAEMRCSVSQQIRIQRGRDEEKRKQVMAERRQQQQEQMEQSRIGAQIKLLALERKKQEVMAMRAHPFWELSSSYEREMMDDLEQFVVSRQLCGNEGLEQPRRVGLIVENRHSEQNFGSRLLQAADFLKATQMSFEKEMRKHMPNDEREDVVPQESGASGHYANRPKACYTHDEMLKVWEDVVRLNYDPTKLPWHVRLLENDLYVERSYCLDDDEEEVRVGQDDYDTAEGRHQTKDIEETVGSNHEAIAGATGNGFTADSVRYPCAGSSINTANDLTTSKQPIVTANPPNVERSEAPEDLKPVQEIVIELIPEQEPLTSPAAPYDRYGKALAIYYTQARKWNLLCDSYAAASSTEQFQLISNCYLKNMCQLKPDNYCTD